MINQNWFANELRSLGWEVKTAGYVEHLDYFFVRVPIEYKNLRDTLFGGEDPDVIIIHDNSAPIVISGLENAKCPVVFLSIDIHHHLVLHREIARSVDLTLVAQKDYIPHLYEGAEGRGLQAKWFPLWAPKRIEPNAIRNDNWCFVGTMNPKLNKKRVDFFSELRSLVDISIYSGSYWDFFTKSHGIINQTVNADLNFRVFEALICGSALLTERIGNGLLELFREDEHLFCYKRGDAVDAAAQAKRISADPALRRRVAEAGREEVLTNHLPEHRAKQLEQIILSLRTQPKAAVSSAGWMVNFAWLGSRLANQKSAFESFALETALQYARACIRQGEALSEAHLLNLVPVACRLDMIEKGTAGETVLYEIDEATNGVPILILARIRQALNRGDINEARRQAKRLPGVQEAMLFSAAEESISQLLRPSLVSEP